MALMKIRTNLLIKSRSRLMDEHRYADEEIFAGGLEECLGEMCRVPWDSVTIEIGEK